ncbi:DUF4097 family beta strand repeat protein [bacterium]|nr:DUF4097 family beta strand repeat protein [bacterium]
MKRHMIVVLLLTCIGGLMAQSERTIEKSFKAVSKIRIKTVSGDVEVIKSSNDKINVTVRYEVEPEGAFEARFDDNGRDLRLSEHWSGRSSRGYVRWTVEVPQNTEIRFSTASGDFAADGLEMELDASTASGDIELTGCKGKFNASTASGEIDIDDVAGEMDLSTASGNIEVNGGNGELEASTASGSIRIDDSKGSFDCSAASGDIDANDLTFEDIADFSVASGDVKVKLSAPLKHDIELTTASGSVTLDFNGQTIKGYFELTAREDRGRIRAPFDFDKEDTFERYDKQYIRKSISISGSEPRIILSTATGRASILR